MLLQISRIYHAERDQMQTALNEQRCTSDQQERSSSRTTESVSGADFANDSD